MTNLKITGHRPFTDQWAAAFCDAINANSEYRESGQRWTWPLALVLEAAPALAYPRDTAVLLDLDKGYCRSASLHVDSVPAAPFILRGDYHVWKQIIKGGLDPIMAVTRKQLRLEGSLATVMLHARSAKILVSCAVQVPTLFPDDEGSTNQVEHRL